MIVMLCLLRVGLCLVCLSVMCLVMIVVIEVRMGMIV